jgi:hypothetical protein
VFLDSVSVQKIAINVTTLYINWTHIHFQLNSLMVGQSSWVFLKFSVSGPMIQPPANGVDCFLHTDDADPVSL